MLNVLRILARVVEYYKNRIQLYFHLRVLRNFNFIARSCLIPSLVRTTERLEYTVDKD